MLKPRITFLVVGLSSVSLYLVGFVAYRAWAESTADSRPHGVPAWYFVYPRQTLLERGIHFVFYPCIRLDQRIQDAKEAPDV